MPHIQRLKRGDGVEDSFARRGAMKIVPVFPESKIRLLTRRGDEQRKKTSSSPSLDSSKA